MPPVDLGRIVRGRASGPEVSVVSERNDTDTTIRKNCAATNGHAVGLYSPRRQCNTTKRRSGTQRKRVIRANVDVILPARPACRGRAGYNGSLRRQLEAQRRIARIRRDRRKQMVALGTHVTYGKQI